MLTIHWDLINQSSHLKDGKNFATLRGRLLHAEVSTLLLKLMPVSELWYRGTLYESLTFSSTEPTPVVTASASAPAIAGFCPLPQNGQLTAQTLFMLAPTLSVRCMHLQALLLNSLLHIIIASIRRQPIQHK
jgi:hypothetical protein